MILDFIHWRVSPEIFQIGVLHIRWYGLLFAASFYFGYILFTRFFKLENIQIEVLDRLTIYMAIGTVVGARLGHCLFYGPLFDVYDKSGLVIEEGYLSHPFNILKVWEGGLASHGAGIAILLILYLFCRKEKRTYFWTLDRIVITVALAGFFIRTGNLMNSEIYGIKTSLPWGFLFEKSSSVQLGMEKLEPRHPTQIYEALSYLLIFVLLYRLYYKAKGKPREGMLFGLFLILTFTMRFIIEFIKNPQVKFEEGMALDMGQWLSIPFVLGGIAILYFIFRKPPPEPM